MSKNIKIAGAALLLFLTLPLPKVKIESGVSLSLVQPSAEAASPRTATTRAPGSALDALSSLSVIGASGVSSQAKSVLLGSIGSQAALGMPTAGGLASSSVGGGSSAGQTAACGSNPPTPPVVTTTSLSSVKLMASFAVNLAALPPGSSQMSMACSYVGAPDSSTAGGGASRQQTNDAVAQLSAHPLPTMSITTPQSGDYVNAEVGQYPILNVQGLCNTPNLTEIDFAFTSLAIPTMTLAQAAGLCYDGALAASIDLTSYPYGVLNVTASMTDQYGRTASLSFNVVKVPRISTSLTSPYSTLMQRISWPAAVVGQTASYQLDLQGSDDCSASPIQSFSFTSSSNLVTFPGTGLYYLCLSFKSSPEATAITSAPLAIEISPLGAPAGSHPWGTGAGSNPMVPDLTSTSWISPTKDSGCSSLIVFNSKTVYMEYQSCPLNFNIIGVEVIKGTYLQSGSELELSPPTSTSCPGRYNQTGAVVAGAANLFVHSDSDGNLYLFKGGELYESYFPLTPYPSGSDSITAADFIIGNAVTPTTQGAIPGCLGGGDPTSLEDLFTSMTPTP